MAVILLSGGLSGCGKNGIFTTYTGSTDSISGTAFPFQSALAATRGQVANGTPDCGSPVTVSLYSVDASGNKSSAPLASKVLTSGDGSYRFDRVKALGVNLDSASSVRYLVEASGCGSFYSRPVTGYSGQNLTAGTSLMSYALNTDQSALGLVRASKREIADYMSKLSGSDINSVFSQVKNDPTLNNAFQSIFGVPVVVLEEAAPQVSVVSGTESVAEETGASFKVSAFHFNPSYSAFYLWKKDGVTVSNSANYTYTPTANDQGLHTLSLYVGQNDGAGNLNTSKPYRHIPFPLMVVDTRPATPPAISVTGSASVVASRNISLDLNTGANSSACVTFSALAITENTMNVPGASDFSINCTQSGTQQLNYTLGSSGDGMKTLRLWAIDSSGNISASPSALNVALDTAPPAVTLVSPSGYLRGGQSISLSLSASDTGSGLNTFKLQYASDGSTFVDVATLSNSATSYSWTIPSQDVSGAKLRVIASDLAGNSATALSTSFGIDSTQPNLAITNLPGVLRGGASSTITFSLSDALSGLSSAKLQYSSDGVTYSDITSVTGADTSYAWNVPLDDTISAKVRLVGTDNAGNTVTATTSTFKIDSTAPIATISDISGPLKGTDSVTVTLSASDALSGIAGLKLQYAADGTSFSDVATLANNATSIAWTVPSADVTTAKLRIMATDAAGNSATATSTAFMIDSTAPSLTAGQMTINDGATATTTNYVQVSLKGIDSSSNITHFCLKFNSTTAPAASDSCWNAVNAPAPGLTPAKSLDLVHFAFPVGFTSGVYTVYAWLKDQPGNVSSLTNSGSGSDGLDRAMITYTPGTPPSLVNLTATSTDNPQSPPSTGDLTVAPNNNVFIKWKATSTNGFGATPISLYYSQDGTSYSPIATNIANAPGGGCSVDASQTGCYTWNFGPRTGYVKIRVTAIDNNSMITFASAPPMNVASMINFLAGNTEPGLGGSASSALFFNEQGNTTNSDPSTFVVTTKGVVFFRDVKRGLLMIDPATGLQSLLIPTTGSIVGDGVNVASAQLKLPLKLALDYQDRILIYDYDRIRRINTGTSPMTIETIIGGGASTADGIPPLSVQFGAVGGYSNTASKCMPLFALPNGDIYFQSDGYTLAVGSGQRYRYFQAASGKVYSIAPSGTGYYNYPTTSLAGKTMCDFAVVFDPVTSAISHMHASVYQPVVGDTHRMPVTLDPSTYIATTPLTPFAATGGDRAFFFQSMSGQIYGVSRSAARIYRYNPGTNNWTSIVGTGSRGICADGTLATACAIDPFSAFVSAQDQLYFVDRGVIRTIDSNGKVLTLMGQRLNFGDGGAPLSARFNVINDIDQASDGKIVLYDEIELRFREFSIGGTINTIAGNGLSAIPDTTSLATAQGVKSAVNGISNSSAITFRINPANGDIFNGPTNGLIQRLDRATGKWVNHVGGGATIFPNADGLKGTDIALTYTPGYSYPIPILGFNGTQMLAGIFRWDTTTLVDSFFKLYAATDGTQAALAGVAGAAGATFSANGTLMSSTAVPRWSAGVLAAYDSIGSRWLLALQGQSAIRTLPPGGSIGTLISLPRTINSFTYRRTPNEIVYYCATSGLLYKYDVTAGVETAYSWPISSISCSGRTLIYSTTGTLIFPYTSDGVMGIAEYIAP